MIVVMPTTPGIRKITWTLQQPTQVNKSEFTSRRRVVVLPKAAIWSASVEIVTIIGETRARPWRSFFAKLQGRAGQFRIEAVEGDQDQVGHAVLVDGAGQQGVTLATKGWFANAGLPEGCLVTVADQLLQLTADAWADADGKAVIQFMPPLRSAPANNAAVETNRPWALVSLTDDKAGWDVDPGQNYTVKFAVEESF